MKLKYRLQRYPSTNEANEYLAFFAECGFMVEALARALYPNGISPIGEDFESPADATRRALMADQVVLFEPTFETEQFTARIDILDKSNGQLNLIEIKAKGFNPEDDDDLFDSKGNIKSFWREYIYDVAFQTMVVSEVTNCPVTPFLCLVDKSKTSSEEAIFSKIRLTENRNPKNLSLPRADYFGDAQKLKSDHLLKFMDVSRYVHSIMPEVISMAREASNVERKRGFPLTPPLAPSCKACEFRVQDMEPSGFSECWGGVDVPSGHIVDLYFAGQLGGKTGFGEIVERGIRSIAEIPDSLVRSESSRGRRQSMQISAFRSGQEVVDHQALRVLNDIDWPIFFLDFETSRIPVPYHIGMNPYEQVPFQFSCHEIGSPMTNVIRHHEWINVLDQYPSKEFAEQLRTVLGDRGTIVVWSPFEQSALRDVIQQNEKYGHLGPGLVNWLTQVNQAHSDGGRILDLMKVCLEGYCHPRMGGSVSIKRVLDAIWKYSEELRADPWFDEYVIHDKDGSVLSPYESLPSAEGFAVKEPDSDGPATVRHGVDAMRAYQDMLYGLHRDDDSHKEVVKKLLLQYCKLDTMAMVMIWKYWTALSK